MDYIAPIINNIAVPASIAILLFSMLSAIFPLLYFAIKKIFSRKAKSDDNREIVRINEALKQLDKHQAIARWYGVANGLLVFSQFVVGGFLASAFAEQQLNPQQVGTLGVLVLVSSLIAKNFRPDLIARGAAIRAVVIKQAIRRASDALYEYEINPNPSSSKQTLLEIRVALSEILNLVDVSVFDERKGETALLPQPYPPNKNP